MNKISPSQLFDADLSLHQRMSDHDSFGELGTEERRQTIAEETLKLYVRQLFESIGHVAEVEARVCVAMFPDGIVTFEDVAYRGVISRVRVIKKEETILFSDDVTFKSGIITYGYELALTREFDYASQGDLKKSEEVVASFSDIHSPICL